MRLILLAAAAFALSGCMFFKADKGLNLFAERDDPQEISDRFHKAAEKQWGVRPGMKAALKGAQAEGFQCMKHMPESMPVPTQNVATCKLTRQSGNCTNAWTIEMRFVELSRDLDPVRVRPDGKFARTCAQG